MESLTAGEGYGLWRFRSNHSDGETTRCEGGEGGESSSRESKRSSSSAMADLDASSVLEKQLRMMLSLEVRMSGGASTEGSSRI